LHNILIKRGKKTDMNAKTIGIISIKGGVGKTSSTVALGAAAAQLGKKVLVIDGNFSSPHLAMHIGFYEPEHTLHDVLSGKINIKEAIYESGYGFDILPGATIHEKISPFKLIDKMREIRRRYDLILIDSSPNLNEEMLATMIASDELLVVTTPDYVTLGSTLSAIRIAKERKTPIAGIILNKVYGKNFEVDLNEIQDTAGVNILAVLPHDAGIPESLAKNIPSTAYKNSEAATEYKKLAAALVGEDYKEGGFKNFMRKLMGKVPAQDINRVMFKQERLNRF